jgi:hypothetical protein
MQLIGQMAPKKEEVQVTSMGGGQAAVSNPFASPV